MHQQFLFLDYEKTRIKNKDFLVINVLEFYSKQIFKIYKILDVNLISKLDTFSTYDNINDFVFFAIKRDGKISLDIKL